MKTRKFIIGIIRLQIRIALGCVICCTPIANGFAQFLVNLGTLNNQPDSRGYGISESARAVGGSGNFAFRTSPNAAIYDYPTSGDNLHNTLYQLLGGGISGSTALDISQSGTAAMEIAGEIRDFGAVPKPFWYYESDNGKTKYARLLYTASGVANSVKLGTGGGASAVVGSINVGGTTHAAYWSVIPTQHWLYDYGNIYFPVGSSVATDTDRNRTVGYQHGNEPGDTDQAFIIDNNAYGLSVPFGSSSSAAYGMNTYGTTSRVVGYYITGGLQKAICWTYTGSGQSSYIVLQLPTGKTQGIARGVNDNGDVVGSAWSNETDEVACMWSAYYGTVTVLNYTSWNLQRAYKVSSYAAGRKIVGFGTTSGALRGFILANW